ncbi:MAG: tetraacyldisaccharide 4'-kinase [Desulfomonile sp.]|nr:tetraacyldisaccharide 4'-kinase [Desulfomonile sp.]
MTSASFPTGFLSAVAAAGYHAVQASRAKAYQWGMLKGRQAPIPVISVGNLLMGGSGKTPFVIRLAELLSGRGRKPAVVSRGYRGTNRSAYLAVGDGKSAEPLVPPSVSGDEPFLIARSLPNVPVLVGVKRIHPVLAAGREFGCDVVVLDDGFQHLPLRRNADIVLLTGREDRMFPLGGLREPFSALARADVAVLVGPAAEVPPEAAPYLREVPVFRCRHVPVALQNSDATRQPGELAGRDVVLVSGIASPDRFRRTAEDLGWQVRRHVAFPDHHVPTDRELERILADAGKAEVIVTEKDWVKLPERFRLSGRISSLRIAMVIDREDELLRVLDEFVRGVRAKHPVTDINMHSTK